MACGTISNNSLSSPVRNTFTMGTPNPVPFLSEVAFSAKLITMVEVYLSAFFILEKITLVVMMTITTGQLIILFSVVDNDISMGKLSGVLRFYKCVVMTFAALKTLYKWLTGKYPKCTSLVLNHGRDTLLGNRKNRLYLRIVIGSGCIFDSFENQIPRGPNGSPREKRKEKERNIYFIPAH